MGIKQTKNQAKQLLLHYFELTGVVTHNGNVAEIEDIIDCIDDLIKARIQEAIEVKSDV